MIHLALSTIERPAEVRGYQDQENNEGRAGETDFWLGWPTRRLPKPAHVLSKNPDSLALGLVFLVYTIGLVGTVRG